MASLLKGGGIFLKGRGKGPPAGGKGFFQNGFVEEDRSQDWYCPICRERNFLKRLECFKCKNPKPKEGEGPPQPPRQQLPPPGSTINGMVKSYNKKGFGFIMVFGVDDQDIYYTRDNVSPRLLHPDMPGEQVTFELMREGGRLVARNIRPIGEPKSAASTPMSSKGGSRGLISTSKSSKEDEDRTRDWSCSNCGERNFLKRLDCFKCRAPRAVCFSDTTHGRAADQAANKSQRRTFSPHAGSRAVREALAAGAGARRGGSDSDAGSGRRRRGRSKNKRKRKRSSSGSGGNSSSSSSESKKKKKKRKKARSSSSAGSGASSSSSCKMEEPAAAAGASVQGSGNPEMDKAKSEALEQLLKLKEVQPKEVRMTEWRALLRQWHPDKNPDRVEVATAVFQFLQKGKAVLD